MVLCSNRCRLALPLAVARTLSSPTPARSRSRSPSAASQASYSNGRAPSSSSPVWLSCNACAPTPFRSSVAAVGASSLMSGWSCHSRPGPSPSSINHSSASACPRHAACKKTPPLSQLFLCLSRACLGKTINSSIKRPKKTAFSLTFCTHPCPASLITLKSSPRAYLPVTH